MTTSHPTLSATRTAAVGLAVVLAVLSSAACGGPGTTSAPGSPRSSPSALATSPGAPADPSSSAPAPAPAVATVMLTIRDFMFGVPASVAPGATVTVTNSDAEAHTVTSKDGGFDVKVGGRGGTATFTAPPAPGRYQLTCDFHADMAGVLVVS